MVLVFTRKLLLELTIYLCCSTAKWFDIRYSILNISLWELFVFWRPMAFKDLQNISKLLGWFLRPYSQKYILPNIYDMFVLYFIIHHSHRCTHIWLILWPFSSLNCNPARSRCFLQLSGRWAWEIMPVNQFAAPHKKTFALGALVYDYPLIPAGRSPGWIPVRFKENVK